MHCICQYIIDSKKWLTFLQKDFKNDNQAIFSEWSGWYISISSLTDFVFLKPILNFKGAKNVICLEKKCFAIRRIVLYLVLRVHVQTIFEKKVWSSIFLEGFL